MGVSLPHLHYKTLDQAAVLKKLEINEKNKSISSQSANSKATRKRTREQGSQIRKELAQSALLEPLILAGPPMQPSVAAKTPL